MPLFDRITMIDYARPLRDRAKARKTCGPYTWTPTAPGNGRGFYQASRGDVAVDRHGSTFDLRLTECAETHRGITGYYADQDTVISPIVARLPHGRGFLCGWTMGRGMCGALEPEIYDSEEEACRAAHDEAERAAEREREYQEEENARMREEEERDAEIERQQTDI